ncbi:CoA transferase [Rhodospirillaceae bacterium KN72]|uniref:CoA transferase n=1 Tax=Pacificispira spongiicola TaxID=2729598 RepID=A0A7Y0E1B1_9PROT|nr:CoA transferase [Pacificispira spongiicola]NMM45371.1 CoA transferase [Pacificispira spongiicola]
MQDSLSGIRVLDFSTLLPGPLATLLMAEAGAEVTKIEPPGGEDMRRFPPFLPDGSGACYRLLNRGKTVRELDLKAPDTLALLTPLIEDADVLVEQFRPGVMDRLGLGYAAVAKINPSIVYCSITGYGQTGPKARKAGHDLTYMAESGILGLTTGADGLPILPPVLTADIAGGTYPAVMRIALALLRRTRTGDGAHLDIAMTDNLRPFAWWAQAIHSATGKTPGPGDWLLNGGSPRYGIYAARDGRAIAVGALEEKFWQALCAAVNLPEALRDDRKDPAATRAALAAAIATRDADDWRPVFDAADCCASIVERLSDVIRDGQGSLFGLSR